MSYQIPEIKLLQDEFFCFLIPMAFDPDRDGLVIETTARGQ
jgi:hypothetical protein